MTGTRARRGIPYQQPNIPQSTVPDRRLCQEGVLQFGLGLLIAQGAPVTLFEPFPAAGSATQTY